MAEGNDERSFLANIVGNFLICSICSEMYKSAKCLPCLHTFCEPCLSQLLKKAGKLDCPICRRTCAVPNGGVAALQNNFFVNDLVEQFKLREGDKNEESTKCGWCEENEGDEVRCIECDMNLCSTCALPHRRVPATKSHRLMPLNEYKEAKSTDPASVISPMYCKKHSSHQLAYFCKTCDEVICLECRVIDHRAPDHQHERLQESAKIYVDELKELRTNLERKERELHKSKENIGSTQASLEKRHNEEIGKLDVHIGRIIQQVRDIGTQFAEKMKSEYESRKTILNGQMKELQSTEDDLSTTCDYIKYISDFGGDAQLMIAKKGITSQAQQLMKKKTKVKPKESDFMEFRNADELVKIEAASVGDVLFQEMCMGVKKDSKSFGSTLDLAIVLKARDPGQTPLFTSTDEVRCTITGCGDSEVQMQVKSGEGGALLLQSGNLQLERDCKLSLFLCATQMKTATMLDDMSLEPLRFHHRCKGKVAFDNDNKSALISSDRAVIFSNRTVKCNEKISVKVKSRYGMIAIGDLFYFGFTSESPEKGVLSSSLRKVRSHMSVGDQHSLQSLDTDNCTFRCWVTEDGQVLYTVNDGRATVRSKGVDTSKALWFVIVCSSFTEQIDIL